MTKRFYRVLAIFGTLQILATPRLSHGFNDNAHLLLSRRSVEPNISILDKLLKAFWFEFPDGVGEILSAGRTVRKELEDGAILEDRGVRVRSHFHNPRLSWNQAGLFTYQSSIVWAQNPNQFSFDKRSWQDARNYYYQALTATTKSERMRLYAETFRTLGHQIHHVQDAATPAHTRNDFHLSFESLGGAPFPDEFHYWADRAPGQAVINGGVPLPFNSSLLNQSSANPNAPIPIARIIDSTDDDIGGLALTPGFSLGLAEYSSANFFSDHTVNSPDFASPNSSQVVVRYEPDATGTEFRPYAYFQSGIGESDYPLALASALFSSVVDPTPTDKGLDDKVFQGYGAKLFPRAIGYSAGLLDYFFRGKITTDGMIQSVIVPLGQPPTTVTFSGIIVSSRNGNDSGGQGTIQLAFRYFDDSTHNSAAYPHVIVSQPVAFNANSSVGQTITFSFDALPFTSSLNDWNQFSPYLIYRGPLGQETDTVIAGGNCHNGGGRGDFGFGRTIWPIVNGIESFTVSHFGCPNPYTFP